jgi:hypothetical protein
MKILITKCLPQIAMKRILQTKKKEIKSTKETKSTYHGRSKICEPANPGWHTGSKNKES